MPESLPSGSAALKWNICIYSHIFLPAFQTIKHPFCYDSGSGDPSVAQANKQFLNVGRKPSTYFNNKRKSSGEASF